MMFLCIYLTFLLQLKVMWTQTRFLWSQDYSFSKNLLSFLNGIHNPDFHVRNLKVYKMLLFSLAYVVELLWEDWA